MEHAAVAAMRAAQESDRLFMQTIEDGQKVQESAALAIEANRDATGCTDSVEQAELRDSLIQGLHASIMGMESYRAHLTDPDELVKLDAEIEAAKQSLAELEEQ